MLVILRRCAASGYRVGTEWDCDLSEQLGNQTLLIPDVSAIAAERLANLPEARRECLPLAPDVVVEVRSPNDRPNDHEWKARAYLEAGAPLVLDVMPNALAIDAIALNGTARFREKDSFHHDAVPLLRFDIAEAPIFSSLPNRASSTL
jgi:Uma2 family endonuclease